MANLRRSIATSHHPVARGIRSAYRSARWFSIPAPRIVFKPLLWLYLALRWTWHTTRRVFIAEPLFKAYCKQYGRRLRTGIFVHWIQGSGDIIVGDDVLIDGKCDISFAA